MLFLFYADRNKEYVSNVELTDLEPKDVQSCL